MLDGRFVAFLGIAALLTITPGADMALVTKHALVNGRRVAFRAMFGIMTGLVVWGALAAAGLAALLSASAAAFTTVKLVGGAYLVYLGVRTLWDARQRDSAGDPTVLASPVDPVPGWQAYRDGLLSNLLNPKVGVFYAVFLPQFVSPDAPLVPQLVLLAVTHSLMGIAWLTCYIRAVDKASDLLRRLSIRLWLDRMIGSVLVALGLRLATEKR